MVVVCCWGERGGRVVCAGREEGRDGDGCAGGVGFAGRDATVGLCRARWSENGGIAIAVCRRRRRDRCRRGGERSLLIQDREISHATLMNRSLPRVRRPLFWGCSHCLPANSPGSAGSHRHWPSAPDPRPTTNHVPPSSSQTITASGRSTAPIIEPPPLLVEYIYQKLPLETQK